MWKIFLDPLPHEFPRGHSDTRDFNAMQVINDYLIFSNDCKQHPIILWGVAGNHTNINRNYGIILNWQLEFFNDLVKHHWSLQNTMAWMWPLNWISHFQVWWVSIIAICEQRLNRQFCDKLCKRRYSMYVADTLMCAWRKYKEAAFPLFWNSLEVHINNESCLCTPFFIWNLIVVLCAMCLFAIRCVAW